MLQRDWKENFREQRLAQANRLVDEAGAKGADIAVLPESYNAEPNRAFWEEIDGMCISTMSELAKKHSMIVVAPIELIDEQAKQRNAAVVIGRDGEVLGHYDKNIPFLCEVGIVPGRDYRVFDTDAGRFGVLICFESQWPDSWMAMGGLQADFVLWVSAYSGGRKLIAPAIYNSYYVITSTWMPDTTVIDINGDELAFAAGGNQVVMHEIDIDRTMVHDNFNGAKLAQIRRDYDGKINMRYMHKEGWWIVESTDPEVSVRTVLKEREVESLREYTQRSLRGIYKLREKQLPLPESGLRGIVE